MSELSELVAPIRRLHDRLRDRVVQACEERSADELARAVHEGSGDVIYEIDRVAEREFLDGLEREIALHEPLVLVGEGLPGGRLSLPRSADPRDARRRMIVDPIDGTRGLMYQKRPGWILTAVAPNHGEATSLTDVELAVQTEIPLVKQHLGDQLWAIRGQGAHAIRTNRLTGDSHSLVIQPSTANDIRDGFATVCRFFPGGRDWLAAIDDDLCRRLIGAQHPGAASVFEDQYASTAGQLYGLMMGQDRFVADLRPLVWPIVAARGQTPGHCCHPYDICTGMIAQEAGVVVTAPDGSPLHAPLDTHTNVAWIGYANRQLQAQIEPVLGDLLGTMLPSSID
jgi:fructose-1,6-bisphosphatase/inositol monophosphatase family enzyme